MKIKTFMRGSDGRVRAIEDRPLKDGCHYMARFDENSEFEKLLCVDVPIMGLAFIDPNFPNFKVATNYYLECHEINE